MADNTKSGNASATDGKTPKKSRKPAYFITIIVVLLIAAYFGVAGFFSSHFLPHTVIDGVDVSTKTLSQAEQAVQEHIDGYKLTISEREGGSETIDGTTISMVYKDDGAISDLLSAQNRFYWVSSLFSTGDEHTVSFTYDTDDLTKAIGKLSCLNPDKMRAPSDIRPAYNGSEYVLQAADYGTTLDTTKTTSLLENTVAAAQSSVDLDKAGCYIDPVTTSATQAMQDKIDYYNKYLKFSITYQVGNKTEVLDANTAESWLVFAADGKTSLDEDKVAAWVKQFAAKYDTVGTTRTFTCQDGTQCTVSGGTYGWQVDQDAEVADIVHAFNTYANETREPYWSQTAASHSSNDWGTTYIDLSLTDQHMWAVKDGVVVLDTDVVTGLPTEKRETSTGVWDILQKSSPYTMHGDTLPGGGYEYVTTCSWWMRMTWTGMGFHDASWQPYFGGDRYTTNGSHGCINMPPEMAEELYGIVEVGWPVVSHK